MTGDHMPIAPGAYDVPVVPQSAAETAVSKIPFWGRLKDLAYTYGLAQWAVGFWSAVYVLITQAHWFGKSFKYPWDHLAQLWHIGAVPGAGHWMVAHYDIFRHIFLRDDPEAILAYSVVAMVIPAIAGFALATKKRDKPPLLDRIMVRLRMPSPYQGQLGRHPDTSALQYVFLLPSMLLAALPGEIVSAAVIFGGIALTHKAGYTGHSSLISATSWWPSIAIGLAGGKFAGHKPAVKAGADIQRFFMGKRIALAYSADKILTAFRKEAIPQAEARDLLTGMRRTSPSLWYPEVYRKLYTWLLAKGAPVRKYGKVSTVAPIAFVAVFVVAGGWGVYLRKYGISHTFWLPW